VLERLLKPSNLDVILERLAECGFAGPWAALTCSAPLADPSLILQEAHALLDSSREELLEHASELAAYLSSTNPFVSFSVTPSSM
jgi:hypothetical protein